MEKYEFLYSREVELADTIDLPFYGFYCENYLHIDEDLTAILAVVSPGKVLSISKLTADEIENINQYLLIRPDRFWSVINQIITNFKNKHYE